MPQQLLLLLIGGVIGGTIAAIQNAVVRDDFRKCVVKGVVGGLATVVFGYLTAYIWPQLGMSAT